MATAARTHPGSNIPNFGLMIRGMARSNSEVVRSLGVEQMSSRIVALYAHPGEPYMPMMVAVQRMSE